MKRTCLTILATAMAMLALADFADAKYPYRGPRPPRADYTMRYASSRHHAPDYAPRRQVTTSAHFHPQRYASRNCCPPPFECLMKFIGPSQSRGQRLPMFGRYRR